MALGNEYHNQIDGPHTTDVIELYIHSVQQLQPFMFAKKREGGDNISVPNLTCIWHRPGYFIASFCF